MSKIMKMPKGERTFPHQKYRGEYNYEGDNLVLETHKKIGQPQLLSESKCAKDLEILKGNPRVPIIFYLPLSDKEAKEWILKKMKSSVNGEKEIREWAEYNEVSNLLPKKITDTPLTDNDKNEAK